MVSGVVGRGVRFTHVLVPRHVADVGQGEAADANGHEGRGAAGALVVRVVIRVDFLHGGVDAGCYAQCCRREGEDGDPEEERDEGVFEEESLRDTSVTVPERICRPGARK